MNLKLLPALLLAGAALAAPATHAQTRYLAGDGFSKSDWNQAIRDRQWTADGAAFEAAAAGASFSTNGHAVRAGRVDADADTPNAFAGDRLVLEGDQGVDGVPGGEGPGTLVLDTGRVGDGHGDAGAAAVYEVDLVVAKKGGKVVVQGGNLRLAGAVELQQSGTYQLNSKVERMSFHQLAPLTGRGNLTLTGGSPDAGPGEKLWVLEDVSGWSGFDLAVFGGNTLRLGPDDASAEVTLPEKSKIRLRDAFLEVPGTLVLASGGLLLEASGNNKVAVPDGRHDAAALNALGFGVVCTGGGTVVVGGPAASPASPVEPN